MRITFVYPVAAEYQPRTVSGAKFVDTVGSLSGSVEP
jgi:hypothetical protein